MLAATNRPDVLDQALLRPAASTARVVQPRTKIGRAAILKVHTRAVPLARDVDLTQIASSTLDWSARTSATWSTKPHSWPRAETRRRSIRDFMDALEEVALGPARRLC